MPVRFAPLRIPLERRLQTLCVLLAFSSQFLGLGITAFCLLYNFYTRAFILAYISWIVYDDLILRTPYIGGRRWDALRNWTGWHYFRDYFPMELVKTCELDPQYNYVFGYHPHGVISMGAFCNFLTEATGFSKKFPGIECSVMVLNSVCRIPFSRDLLLSAGVRSCERTSCNYVLQSGPGKSILLAVGGAQEALDAHPQTLVLTLASRFGFVKVALANGARLVPCIAFGENDLFGQISNPKGSLFRAFQDKVQKLLGFSVPVIYGRGVFNYTFGLMPHRKKVFCVVGKPLELPKIENPSKEEVEKYHQAYIKALTELFETNKDKYFPDRKDDLVIH